LPKKHFLYEFHLLWVEDSALGNTMGHNPELAGESHLKMVIYELQLQF
jgi:hypothetical protein